MAAMCQSCGAELSTWTGHCPHCGGTARVDMVPRRDPMLEKVIGGRYRINRKLGQGGMGSVYLAEHVGVGQRVAIKFLNPNFSGNPDVVRRFLNEAKSYGQISHPHAVQLHDFGQDEDGSLYISMEYVEGRDLKRELEQEGRLSVKDALDVVLQVSEVLGYAHSKGIVHRDLKPENIMLVKGLRGYHAKVLDFGVARLMAEQGTRLTAAGSICGTPRYMSPEQAEGRDVDHRTDIYALGLVLFELVTGVHPFTGGSIAETLRKQVMDPMPHIADVAPDLKVPEGLDQAVQKAVAKQREQRFEAMGDFARTLVTQVPTSTVEAFQPDGSDPTLLRRAALEKTSHQRSPYERRAPARRGVLFAGLAVAGLVVAVGGVWYALSSLERTAPVGWDALDTAAATPALKAPTEPDSAPVVGGSVDAAGGVNADPQAAKAPVTTTAREARPASDGELEPSGDAASVRLLAETAMFAQANNEYLAGRLATASQMLKTIPDDSPVSEKVVDLQRQIDELSALMRKADGMYRKGRCREAIGIYEQVRRRNAGIGAAAQGIARCRREIPAGMLE